MDRALADAAKRLDHESERLISYLNEEVVPSIRKQSSRGLRTAAQRLKEFADYLESAAKR